MEKIDQALQSKVWQRVQNRDMPDLPALGKDNLKPLLLTAQENQQVYQTVSRQLPGKEGEKIRKLQMESRNCIACMKGICRIWGEPVKVPQLPVEKEPVKRALMKCYHRENKLRTEWEHRTTDPEYGAIYTHLAQRAREHCVAVMEVLGSLEN